MRNNAKDFKQKKKNRLYFSNLTVIMLCCVIFFSISLIINIAKAICFNHKLNQVQKYYKEAMILKRNLNDEI